MKKYNHKPSFTQLKHLNLSFHNRLWFALSKSCVNQWSKMWKHSISVTAGCYFTGVVVIVLIRTGLILSSNWPSLPYDAVFIPCLISRCVHAAGPCCLQQLPLWYSCIQTSVGPLNPLLIDLIRQSLKPQPKIITYPKVKADSIVTAVTLVLCWTLSNYGHILWNVATMELI